MQRELTGRPQLVGLPLALPLIDTSSTTTQKSEPLHEIGATPITKLEGELRKVEDLLERTK